MKETILKIEGMSCGGCVRRLTAALKMLPGVQVDEVSVGRAQVRLDPAVASEEQVIKAIRDAGYTSSVEG